MPVFKVYFSNHSSETVKADTPMQAKIKVWKDIENSYRYGWNEVDFLNCATVEPLPNENEAEYA